MSKIFLISLVSIIVANIIIFAWFYLFNIYEVKIIVTPDSKILTQESRVEISVIPLNSFGIKAFFRNISADFKFVKGSEIVRVEENSANSIFVYSKGEKGNVELLIEPSIGFFPSKVKIKVE